MGTGRYRSMGATIGAAAFAIVVALAVAAMVSAGGGINHPLVAHRTVAMNAPAQGQG